MTLKKQSFDLGTNGATVTNTNTAGSGIDAFNTVNVDVGATCIFDNTDHAHGTQCETIASASGKNVTDIWSGLSSTDMAVSVYFKIDTLPTSDLYLIRFTVGGVRKASLHINSAGKLRMSDSTGTTGLTGWTNGGGTAAGATFPLNTWIRVELRAQSTATNATYTGAYYTLDSTTATDSITVSTANGGGTAFDAVTFGKGDTSAYTGTIKIDSIQLNDAATGLIGIWTSAASSPVRPNVLISNAGGFTAVGAADIPTALADELDTTYAISPASPAGAVMEVGFPALSAGGNISAIARHWATAASPAITRTYYVVEGSTIRHTEPGVVLPTAASNYTVALTSGETAAVTDRSNLRLRLSDTV